MASSWSLVVSSATDQGKVRLQNQDNSYVDPQGRYLALADGMGGHLGGEFASRLTIEAVNDILTGLDWTDLPSPETIVENCIFAATEKLKEWVTVHPEQADLGTTLLLLIRNQEQIIIASLGDSRIYLLRDNRLFQMTFDQTIESELRRRGATRDLAAASPGANYLSRCILATRMCEPDIMCIDSRLNDVWLLCSDGLTREVDDFSIQQMMIDYKDSSPEALARALVDKALAQGGRDNITVMIAKFLQSTPR